MPHDTQSLNRVRDQARQTRDLTGFDYGVSAELFPTRNRKGGSKIRYRRFDTAAEAVRFAVEEAPAPAMLGAYLEVGEVRFGLDDIRDLYDNEAYPLERRLTEKSET